MMSIKTPSDSKRIALQLFIATGLLLAGAAPSMAALPAPPPCTVTIKLLDNVQTAINAQPGGSTFCFQPGTYRLPTAITARTGDRKSTRLNSSHLVTSYAVFCLKN